MTAIFGFWGGGSQAYEDKARAHGYHPFYSDGTLSLWSKERLPKELSYFKRQNISVWFKGHSVTHFNAEQNPAKGMLMHYLQKGIQGLSEIEGSFFLLIRDHQNLYLCRDPVGSELLYHYQDANDTLVFSNKLETLIKLTGKPEISKASLFEYLRFLEISAPSTIYQNIFLLEPNQILCMTFDKPEWIAKQSARFQTIAGNPVDIFEGLLLDSIQRRIAGVDGLGAFLSCGIDSSLICALISRLNIDCKIFTVGFNDPQFDESKAAQAIAHHLGLEHEILIFDPHQDMTAFHEFTRSAPTPFADPALIPTHLCFKALKNRVDRILDGTGADSLIGAMPCRHIRFILDYSKHIPDWARKKISRIMKWTPAVRNYADLFDFEDECELMIPWKGFNRSEIADLCRSACDFSNTYFYKTYQKYSNKTPYEIYSKLFQAMNDDRVYQMAARLELKIEFPYMDKKTHAYVDGLTENWKYSKGESKFLYKRVLEKYLPEKMWNQPKHGFDYPFQRLLQYEDHQLIKRYLYPGALKRHGFFDADRVEAYVARFNAGDMEVKFKIWALVIFQAWYEDYYLARQ